MVGWDGRVSDIGRHEPQALGFQYRGDENKGLPRHLRSHFQGASGLGHLCVWVHVLHYAFHTEL